MTNDSLKPCPFCGGPARIEAQTNCNLVACRACRCRTCAWLTVQEAVCAWNHRAYLEGVSGTEFEEFFENDADPTD